ncbi:hypothetical protein [Alicyclobacillus sp. TC]|nr:hypothetical protein [Alicyclobacillus sp. TC]
MSERAKEVSQMEDELQSISVNQQRDGNALVLISNQIQQMNSSIMNV